MAAYHPDQATMKQYLAWFVFFGFFLCLPEVRGDIVNLVYAAIMAYGLAHGGMDGKVTSRS